MRLLIGKAFGCASLLAVFAAGSQARAAADVPKTVLESTLARLDCVIPASMAAIDAESYPLDVNTTLAIVPCISGGVNVNSILFLIDARKPGQAELLEFVHWDYNVEKWSKTNNLMNVDFDAGKKTISATERCRGMGDCGNGGKYAWSNGKFVLTSYGIKKNCDGKTFDPSASRWRVTPPR